MLTRARTGGALTVVLVALIISTGAPAHAETVTSPDPTGEVIEEPAVPPGSEPYTEPTVPEGTFEPAPTGPVPTAVPTVAPPAPVGTAPFESTRPDGTVVEYFRSGDATTPSRGRESETSGGTDNGLSRDTAPAPQVVEPETESARKATASPTPVATTAPASPVPDDARGGSVEPGAAVPSTSAQRAPTPTLPTLVIGMAVLVGGLLLMRYRTALYHATVRAEKQLITTGSGERAERLQGPFRIGVAGAVVALIGVMMNGYAGWQLWISLTS